VKARFPVYGGLPAAIHAGPDSWLCHETDGCRCGVPPGGGPKDRNKLLAAWKAAIAASRHGDAMAELTYHDEAFRAGFAAGIRRISSSPTH